MKGITVLVLIAVVIIIIALPIMMVSRMKLTSSQENFTSSLNTTNVKPANIPCKSNLICQWVDKLNDDTFPKKSEISNLDLESFFYFYSTMYLQSITGLSEEIINFDFPMVRFVSRFPNHPITLWFKSLSDVTYPRLCQIETEKTYTVIATYGVCIVAYELNLPKEEVVKLTVSDVCMLPKTKEDMTSDRIGCLNNTCVMELNRNLPMDKNDDNLDNLKVSSSLSTITVN